MSDKLDEKMTEDVAIAINHVLHGELHKNLYLEGHMARGLSLKLAPAAISAYRSTLQATSAAMPSVEDVLATLREALRPLEAEHMRGFDDEEIIPLARAILDLFAPILAESRNASRYADEVLKTRADAAEANALKSMWQARALAAEAERDAALLASRHEADMCEQALAGLKAAEAALAAERERCVQIAVSEANRARRSKDIEVREAFTANKIAAAIRAQGE